MSPRKRQKTTKTSSRFTTASKGVRDDETSVETTSKTNHVDTIETPSVTTGEVLRMKNESELQCHGDSDGDKEEEEEKAMAAEAAAEALECSRNCPYLDTIDRSMLDFDFERVCSVNLTVLNVYACLVCGKYFQGRGKHTPAYTHSVQAMHRVFINLDDTRVYCLPDGYEVLDSSLSDIKFVLNPTYSKEDIGRLDCEQKRARALDGSIYWPGLVGLNNIDANDYINVVMQALVHVPPLRNFFLQKSNYEHLHRIKDLHPSDLVLQVGKFFRHVWNPRMFKAHVSPEELVQSIARSSAKKFVVTRQSDPSELLAWILNKLHMDLGGTKKSRSSIIHRVFQGRMRIHSRKIPRAGEGDGIDHVEDDTTRSDADRAAATAKRVEWERVEGQKEEYRPTVTESPFLLLTCDLPSTPLFKDEAMKNIIPQVPLYTLLEKFNGIHDREYKTWKDLFMRRYEILELPQYLIILLKRISKNNFFLEMNPTIVNFPVVNLDLTYLLRANNPDAKPAKYDLVSSIYHEGSPDPGAGVYRVHMRHAGTGQWFQAEDLHITDVLPQMIALSKSYIQIYQRQDV